MHHIFSYCMKMAEFSDNFMHMMVADPEKVRMHVESFYFCFVQWFLCPRFKHQKKTSL